MDNNYRIIGGELYHYGVKGMRWGVRRYRNSDGSLTPAGSRRRKQLERVLERNVRSQTKTDNKLLNARAKNRNRFESRYDKKLAKTAKRLDRLSKKKKSKLKDFDEGTKAIRKAQKIGNENHNKFLELKIKAISDPTIKQSKSYKQAKKWHSSQVASELMNGKSYTLLAESSAVLNGKSWTRGKL
jgi:hypothetical protein